jgi:hypothetical protein
MLLAQAAAATGGEFTLSEVNFALLVVGGLILVIGLLSELIRSELIRRSLLSEPLVALLIGILLGP